MTGICAPITWDTGIRQPARAHQPQAEVGLIVQSAESRERCSGSPLLFLYVVKVARPSVGSPASLRLSAPGATPLLLAISLR